MKNNLDDDYGFSTFSTEEYEERIRAKAQQPVDEYKKRLAEVEDMILPFLQKLRDSGEKEYIYWPNRTEAINNQINKLMKLTRG